MSRYEGWWQGALAAVVAMLLSGKTPGLVQSVVGAALGVWLVRWYKKRNPPTPPTP